MKTILLSKSNLEKLDILINYNLDIIIYGLFGSGKTTLLDYLWEKITGPKHRLSEASVPTIIPNLKTILFVDNFDKISQKYRKKINTASQKIITVSSLKVIDFPFLEEQIIDLSNLSYEEFEQFCVKQSLDPVMEKNSFFKNKTTINLYSFFMRTGFNLSKEDQLFRLSAISQNNTYFSKIRQFKHLFLKKKFNKAYWIYIKEICTHKHGLYRFINDFKDSLYQDNYFSPMIDSYFNLFLESISSLDKSFFSNIMDFLLNLYNEISRS